MTKLILFVVTAILTLMAIVLFPAILLGDLLQDFAEYLAHQIEANHKALGEKS